VELTGGIWSLDRKGPANLKFIRPAAHFYVTPKYRLLLIISQTSPRKLFNTVSNLYLGLWKCHSSVSLPTHLETLHPPFQTLPFSHKYLLPKG